MELFHGEEKREARLIKNSPTLANLTVNSATNKACIHAVDDSVPLGFGAV
jgi:hypothetical protein